MANCPSAGLKEKCPVICDSTHQEGLTFTVVKKYSPGVSCRNRTPLSATGLWRSSTRSLAKVKHGHTAPWGESRAH